MIIRIVKMTFHPDMVDDFLGVFNEMNQQIKDMPGCLGLTLLRDKDNETTFFTYSTWEDEAALEAYRHTPFFHGIWGKAKQGFSDKPAAWSLEEVF